MSIYAKRTKWEDFSQEEHEVWSILFNEQVKILKDLVDDSFFSNLEKLNMHDNIIPKIDDLNEKLMQSSGVELIFDNGTVVGKNFFLLLSKRKFPSTMFIRNKEHLYYLTEPDIFHDIFGHCPFLYDPIVGEILELFGEIGLKCIENKISTKYIGRLYWYTIEFGLIKSKTNRLNIFGGGIISSKSESHYSIHSDIPIRLPFNPELMMRTNYTYNEIQTIYFILDSVEQLRDYLKDFNIDTIKAFQNQHDVDTASLRIDEIKC